MNHNGNWEKEFADRFEQRFDEFKQLPPYGFLWVRTE